MSEKQPNTAPLTDLERYYEAMYYITISKPGSSQYVYWMKRKEELEIVTSLLPKH